MCDYPVSTLDLAKNGFFFAGNDQYVDGVQCFYCQVFLYDWDNGDNVAEEHVKANPRCPVFGSCFE